jgi:hypothetical protein
VKHWSNPIYRAIGLIYYDMTPESQNSGVTETSTAKQRLCKDFPWQRIRKQQSRYCWVITTETVFSFESALRLYNKDLRPIVEDN